jgi:aldose 1-epimerase
MLAETVLPSGEQFEIRHGDQHVVVTEVGATLRSYTVAGRELLDGFSPEEMCPSGRGHVLLPWPNRVDGGRYTFQGKDHQLPLNEPGRVLAAGPTGAITTTGLIHAIHGLTRWLAWYPAERGPAHLALELVLYPQPGYPFALALTVIYALSNAGLDVTTSARNVGATPSPFGAGHHPYLTVGTERIDLALLRLPAETRLTSNDRRIPTGREAVAGTAYDFRAPRPIGDLVLDTCFTDLAPDADGRARLTLTHPSGEPTLTLALDPAYRFVLAFTGDTLADLAARRRSLSVEPSTCAPNAFNSGDGLRVLAPGETFSAAWELGVG